VVQVELYRCWQKLRPGEAIRGKWRILDGKKDEWSGSEMQSSKVVAPAYVN
jgi:hypothetical protein